MSYEKYTTHAISVSAILGHIEAKDIAVPEIQRPFVWKRTQVRDLLDSLYKGYPTGYLILWQNPNQRLKDGTLSQGKKLLIDGQQRVTALMTAIAGIPVVNDEYKKERVKIAFNPFAAVSQDPDAEVFAVQDQSHLRDKRWIRDVADVFANGFNLFSFVQNYCAENPDMEQQRLADVITGLKEIGNRQIGVIELNAHLDIDLVTDIFIRINSKGTALSQGDFVMSKIAADETHGGMLLRKLIDYFAHLSKAPAFFEHLQETDREFSESEYMPKVEWLRDETETVYDPTCDDVIRVAFMRQYPRSRLADLVSLLSGRDFETREYREDITDETYVRFRAGVLEVVNENNFKQFMLTIRGAGFVSEKLVNSNMALDFAYTIFLRSDRSAEAKRLVQKWYVLSILTGRYSSSPESSFGRDLRQIEEFGLERAFRNIEAATLSEGFWTANIPQHLSFNVSSNPVYQVYLAAQVAEHDVSLLSSNVTVEDLITIQGDVHHIFPKKYLIENGLGKNKYNQNANYAFLDTQVNKSIGKRAPKEYFSEAFQQCETGVAKCGTIVNLEQLRANLAANCIPEGVETWEFGNFEEFLEKRRALMAAKIRRYYESL